MSNTISTVVVKMAFPVASSTSQEGAKNEAAGLFATKTPAFTTQDGNPKRLIDIWLSNIAHPFVIEQILPINTCDAQKF
jgi:hypothetical protein